MSEGFHQNLENCDERIGAENFATVPKATSVRSQRRVWLPLLLFAATCYTTLKVGGPVYAGAIMATLLCHEFGHFLQAVRFGVPASLPFFIPMPGSPVGTMGAVIMMQPGRGDRKQIFDIAITGPLAGLVFALAFSILGLHLSQVITVTPETAGLKIG